jgi:6-pyruvoyl-tetrahydropterin synthase
MILVGARAQFCAGHKLPQHGDIHGHSYEVWAYVKEGPCVEELQRKLQSVCKRLDHKMLNDILSPPTMEKIAEFVAANLAGAENVIVRRPLEGLTCEWSAP